jgi:predicted RNA-binding protein YlqC (UPF0109 family)
MSEEKREESAEPTAEERLEALGAFLARSLVDGDPEEVGARVREDRGTLKVLLTAPSRRRGRLIGRGGHIVRSLRTIAEHADIDTHLRIELDIAE